MCGLRWAAVFLVIVGVAASLSAHEQDDPRGKTLTAVRAATPPRIDGVLDDDVWQRAPVASGFTQRDPVEGVPASEDTAFQVAYDDEALYIGIACYDSEPEKIVRRLYRRDDIRYGETDWVGIRLDPHHDHQTGFGFAITPSGSYADNVIVNDSGFDGTWDSVWEVRTSIHDKGWNAELRIPYHALRFSPKEEYTWGINLDRRIIRKQEYDLWAYVPRDATGISSRNGHLVGIRDIRPPAHLEVLPYSVLRETFEPVSPARPTGRDFLSGVGADVRYGLASNVSLNATLNPDFGQVEADPAVLNLTVFETFFDERRPFFVEGAGMFQTPTQLFYSRRIGRRPGYFPTPAGATVLSRPEATTILGAAKLTGKTRGKTSFGVVEAITAAEYATVEETANGRTRQRDHLIEPLANYFVGRAQQDILGGSSNVGLLMTSVLREEAASAYTGGLDWNLRTRGNTYGLSGQAVGSSAGRSAGRRTGYAARLNVDKRSGWLTGGAHVKAVSREFDVNDLGFVSRPDELNAGGRVTLRRLQPWGPIRDGEVSLSHFSQWNYDGVNRGRSFELWAEVQFLNYWWVFSDIVRELESLNDWKTRGGPLMVEPDRMSYFLHVGTDNRKPFSAGAGASWSPTSESRLKGVGGGFGLRPAPALQVNLFSDYRWSRPEAEWVANVDDDGDGTPDHFVFGELTTNTLDVTARANVAFTPRLSLQLYLQSFVAVGDYENFKELARPRSFDFLPYPAPDFDPDFHDRSLRSNLVLRWEYRPGSTLFLVWSQSRSGTAPGAAFRPLEDVGHTFTDTGRNTLFVKWNYWVGI